MTSADETRAVSYRFSNSLFTQSVNTDDGSELHSAIRILKDEGNRFAEQRGINYIKVKTVPRVDVRW